MKTVQHCKINCAIVVATYLVWICSSIDEQLSNRNCNFTFCRSFFAQVLKEHMKE